MVSLSSKTHPQYAIELSKAIIEAEGGDIETWGKKAAELLEGRNEILVEAQFLNLMLDFSYKYLTIRMLNRVGENLSA